MLNIAHRGASGIAPEHTFPAYDLAVALGADYLELDVHMTRDGRLVVVHDATLDRTGWGCSGFVADHSVAELRTCDAGSWFNETYPERARREFAGAGIPTLEDVFRRYGSGVRYYVEMKDPELYPGMEEEMLRELSAHGLPAAGSSCGVLLQSFSGRSLRKIHALDPTLPLIRLYPETGSGGIADTFEETARYASGVGPHHHDVDGRLVGSAHALGLDVHTYTVDSPSEMEALAELGVDGVFTNFPDRLAALDAGSAVIRAGARS